MPMRCTLTMQLLYRHCNLWILVTNSAVMQLPKMRNVNRLVRSLGFSSLPTQISPLPLDFQSLYAYISTSTAVSLSMALRYYINRYSPYHGLKIHTHILKIGFQPNTNISIKLLIMHLKCGYLDNARQVFDEMTQPTPAAYNYLMDGYVKHGRFGELFDLVRGMGDGNEKPDGFTYALILKAWISGCSSPFLRYDFGRQVHTHIVKSDLKEDIILFGSLLDAYVKCRRVHYARRLFDTNTMLLKNVICSTSLIAGYMSEGCVEDAEVIFEKTVNKDVVVLNAMIEGYSKSIETAKKAAEMYIDLKRMGFHPTVSTFASLIGACSLLTTVEIGQQVQCELMKMDCLNEIKIASALIDMYSKCGKVEDAHKIFDSMPERNVFSWTSLIDGYGKNGKPFEALELFRIMQKRHQITPNYITFLSVLSTCAHNGLLDEGKEIYRSMEKDFKLKPKMEHYACMVDLLGRFGSVDEAWRFIKGMPEKPDSDVWAALLSSCNLHGEVEIAKIAANELFKLGADGRPGSYVSLSNTLAAAGQWGGVINVRESMKLRRISKDTGFTKVADFGLAKFDYDSNTHVSTRIMGTFGYVAPEYAASGKLSEKSDVFSFGVVLFELITGHRPIEPRCVFPNDDNIVEWARPLLRDWEALETGNFDRLVDPKLEDYNVAEMAQMVACAAACVHCPARERPQMSQVVQALEGNLPIENPFNRTSPPSSTFSGSSDDEQVEEDLKKFQKLSFESMGTSSSGFAALASDSDAPLPSIASTEHQSESQDTGSGNSINDNEDFREIPIL